MRAMDANTGFGSRWMASRPGMLLPLGITMVGLVAGGLLHWTGVGTWGNLVWIIVGLWHRHADELGIMHVLAPTAGTAQPPSAPMAQEK
jgi:hypothetical protein